MSKLPLDGVRVIDMTVVWAGPFACALLADLGAEVIRIESLNRGVDVITRTAGNAKEIAKRTPDADPDAPQWDTSINWNTVGRNRRGITLDLTMPEGRENFYRLIAISDVFIENNAPSTVHKLQIDYETLKHYNPNLVMASMSAFGATGPYRDFRAYGAEIEAVMGYLLLRGYANNEPFVNSAGGFSDAVGGATTAMAVLAALEHLRATGDGQYLDVAQSETFVQTLSPALMDYAMNGRSRLSTGNRDPERVPQGAYQCSGDDRYIAISVGNDTEFAALVELIGHPEHIDDPAFAMPTRAAHHDLLDDEITAWTSVHEQYEAFHLLQTAGIAAAPVLDQEQLASDPHLQAREDWETLTLKATGTHQYLKSPIWHFSETPLPYRFTAPTLGKDNEYVYKGLLGLSDEEFAELERIGQVGTTYPSGSAVISGVVPT